MDTSKASQVVGLLALWTSWYYNHYMLAYDKDGWRCQMFYCNQTYVHSCFTLTEKKDSDYYSMQLTVDFFPYANTCTGFLFLKTLRQGFVIDIRNIRITNYDGLESVIKKYKLDDIRSEIEEAKQHLFWPWRRIEAF